MEQTDNNKDTFDKRASKDESSPLDTSMDIGTLSLEQRAREEKLFLLSEESRDVDGNLADWRHFNFMIDEHGANYRYVRGRSVAGLLRSFWGDLWQYISPLLKSYEQLSVSWENTMADMDQILKSHAELKFERDIMAEFFKGLPADTKENYRKFKAFHESRIAQKIKQIQTEEGLASEEKRIKGDNDEKTTTN